MKQIAQNHDDVRARSRETAAPFLRADDGRGTQARLMGAAVEVQLAIADEHSRARARGVPPEVFLNGVIVTIARILSPTVEFFGLHKDRDAMTWLMTEIVTATDEMAHKTSGKISLQLPPTA